MAKASAVEKKRFFHSVISVRCVCKRTAWIENGVFTRTLRLKIFTKEPCQFFADLFYIFRFPVELLSNGYTISEHWLATNDDKLYVIANDIKPKKTSEGFGYLLESVRESELLVFQYWKDVDLLSDTFLKGRNYKTNEFNNKIEHIERSILEIEAEFKKYID